MNIGIIGVGNVGGTLGLQLASRGHAVRLGVRDPHSEKVAILLSQSEGDMQAVSVADAVAFGDVVVLAVPWTAVSDVIAQGGDWSGKIIVDATNRFGPGMAASAGEEVARMAPGANVVKAFNTIGAEHLANPRFGDSRASMFICGDDEPAKAVVAILAEDLGFDVVDAGALANAGLLESLARLWIYLARYETGRDVAFKLLRR